MKLGQAIKQAVARLDAAAVGRIADRLRFSHRLTYEGTFQLFHKHTGISKQDFESLMYEADRDSEMSGR